MVVAAAEEEQQERVSSRSSSRSSSVPACCAGSLESYRMCSGLLLSAEHPLRRPFRQLGERQAVNCTWGRAAGKAHCLRRQ